MRSKFKWIFTLLVAFTMQFSFAQDKTVTGVVSDNSGPLPGANVVVKGTTRGVQTDLDGKYSIKTKVGETLVYSFIGLEDQSKQVGVANTMSVKLGDAKTLLNEVVVLGYDRTSTKAKSTVASTTVSADQFKNRPNVSLLQSLQGAAPGLTVSVASGSPGSAKIDLLIRGVGTLSGATEPLYVIDGVPANSVVFRGLNPEDIESASILRDAIATSIYGNRGTNGVIVITTKKGGFDTPLKINYTSSFGFSYLPEEDYNLANSKQYLRIQRDFGVGAGAGQNPLVNDSGVAMTDEEIENFSGYDNNWRKIFFRTGVNQTHNLSLTSGSKNLSSFTSVSYTDQTGIVPTTDFKRFTLRNNLNGKSSNEKFTYGTSFTTAFSRRNQLDQETGAINNNSVQNPLLGSLTAAPFYDPSMYPGSGQALYDMIGQDFTNGQSTFVLYDILQEGNLPNRIDELKILGNFNINYNFTKAFSFGSKFGVDYTHGQRIFARAPWSYLAVVVRESSALPFGGLERRIEDRDFGFNIVNNFKYTKTFKEKHTLSLGVYQEYLKAQRTASQLTQTGLDLLTYSFGAGTGWTNVGANFPALRPAIVATKQKAGNFSYFGTLSYEFEDKYGVDAIIRRDASYRFVEDNTWGTFWSVGGRWNIDREKFMDNSVFSMLKLRGSYGTQGNQNILGVATGANPIYSANNNVRDLASTGTGYANSGSYVTSQIADIELMWETQAMANIGIDFEVYKGRFSGNIDVYNRRTEDLFTFKPISAAVGNTDTMAGNNGSINNKGIEYAFKYKIFKDTDFKLAVFVNGSYNKNEFRDIERAAPYQGDFINENGAQVGEYYLVPYIGVNPANGNLLFMGADGTPTENPDDNDRIRTNKTSTPVYQGAFGLNAEYKGFFLDGQFTYVKDVWRKDYGLMWLNTPSYSSDLNVSADLLDAWTSTNTNTNIPSMNAANFDAGEDYSDMWLKNADYVRLKNVSLGYTFNDKQLRGSFISSLKIFVQGENLYTWTKWRGFDPDSYEGDNLGRFPSPRTFSFGVNVEF